MEVVCGHWDNAGLSLQYSEETPFTDPGNDPYRCRKVGSTSHAPLRDRIQNCPVGHVRSFQYAAKNIDKAAFDETGAKKRMYPVTSKFN